MDVKVVDKCRSCGSGDLALVIDLGEQYLSDFRENDSRPPSAPLTLMMCEQCTLVQLAHTVPRDELYGPNYGFRSGVNEGIVKDLEGIVKKALMWVPRPKRWLDIASNDGTLLSFVDPQVHRIGIDPVAKFADQAKLHADEIITDYFNPEVMEDTKFNVITSISMFYDIDDLNEFVSGVASVLAKDGIWIIQQNYLLDMVRLGAVDNICHEHLTYFSLLSLENLLNRHSLRVISAATSPVNGGVFRVIVVHKENPQVPVLSREHMRTEEKEFGLQLPITHARFAKQAEENIEKLSDLVLNYWNADESIYVYGASTRGAVLWQAANVNGFIQCAVERQPEKIGKWYSPIGVPIISEEQMRHEQPDVLLIGPWWHRDQFIEREREYLIKGGSMVFPLPYLEVFKL